MFEDAHAQEPTKDQFELGRLVATPAALELLHQLEVILSLSLAETLSVAWGDLDSKDVRANEAGLGLGTESSQPTPPHALD